MHKKENIASRMANLLREESFVKPLSPEEEQLILKKRALALAFQPKTGDAQPSSEVLFFTLSGETYALETRFIREVHALKDLTPLPQMPPFLKGISNVRGEIISVNDIKIFFELPSSGITDLNKIIILHNEQMTFGILADRIMGVNEILLTDIHPPLPTMAGRREEYVKGITADGIIILDAQKLLNDNKLIINEEI
ncbi:MAG: chemotaxis protein CheW [Syntrophothermus sp.]